VAVTKQDLAAAQLRLSKGQRLDRTLATTIPLLELVVSPAPVYLGEFLVLGVLALRLADARKRERAARNQVAAFAQQFETDFTDLIVPVGGRPEDAERLLMGAPQALPPAEPTPDARPDPTADGDPPDAPDAPASGPAPPQDPSTNGDGARPLFDENQTTVTNSVPNSPWSLA
jgi:type II secretory pathway pseudopilin PulG